MRKIQIVAISKMEQMRKYLFEYLIELSEFDPDIKLNEKGEPIYKWFDCYFEDKDRYPIYFLVNNDIAGLSLVREIANCKYEIAEFYVLPEYRKDGNAIFFANEITNLFDGEFVFSTRLNNIRAVKFWNKFALLNSDNSFVDDGEWASWTIRKNNYKTNTLNLKAKYYDLIKNGEKVFEGRLNDEKRQLFNVGDEIIFYKEPEKIESFIAVITDKILFSSFDEMAESLDKDKLGFKNKTRQEMIDTYRSFYSRENENKYGVVVFKVKVVTRT